MESGLFARKLRCLNPELRIWCSDDDLKPAGLFYVHAGEYVQICGVDKQSVPKNTIFGKTGRIIKAGYLRTLKILIERGLVDRRKAEQVFNCRIPPVRIDPSFPDEKNKVMDYLRECNRKGYLKPEEIVDAGREIQRLRPMDESKIKFGLGVK